MHIPDGFTSTEINATTYVVSGAVAYIAVRNADKSVDDKQVPLIGITAAFIFAAQMLNFPVLGGTSGHFLGAVLAAILLGPLGGFLVMLIVLTLQCLLFADGGLTALGTNVFNMGIIGGMGGYLVFAGLLKILPNTRQGFLTASAAASWLSVVLASVLCSIELAVSGTSPVRVALPAMVGVHSLIGTGEAIITSVVLSMVLSTRPDLLRKWLTPKHNHSNAEVRA